MISDNIELTQNDGCSFLDYKERRSRRYSSSTRRFSTELECTLLALSVSLIDVDPLAAR